MNKIVEHKFQDRTYEKMESMKIRVRNVRLNEVTNAIRSLKNGKACGIDGISVEVLA